MSPEASRHRRRIGRLLIANKLPYDYIPENRPMPDDSILCVLCRRPNPNPLSSACPKCIPPDEGEMILQGKVAARDAEIAALKVVLSRIINMHEFTTCRLDHHGYCQEHNYAMPCPIPDARGLIGKPLPS